MPGRRDAGRAELLQRLAEIDNRLADHNERLSLSLRLAAEASERWRTTAGQLERLRFDATPEERADVNDAADHSAAMPSLDAAGLFAWVGWLVPAYDLSQQWPLCWYRHEGLVTQLLALRRWHTALLTELWSDPTAPAKWHDALYRLSERATRSVTQSCLATHRDPPAIPAGDRAQLAAPSWGPRPRPPETPEA